MNKRVLILLVLLAGCNLSDDESNADEIVNDLDLSQELQAQATIDDQFGVLYSRYHHLLDRSESLTGTDKNNDGIRDDIEMFIDMLEVTEPIRNVIKQNARFLQENLYYDFSENTAENVTKAINISNKHLKIIACEGARGVPMRDAINVGKTLVALTYNTKARTFAYLAYNHLLDGSTSVLLPDEEQYCE